MLRQLGAEAPQSADAPGRACLLRLLRLARRILETSGFPVFEEGVLPASDQNREADAIAFAMPAAPQRPAETSHALHWAARTMRLLLENGSVISPDLQQQLVDSRDLVVRRLSQNAPGGSNTLHFLRSAHERGIPWSLLAQNVFRFGWGCRSELMDSSLTGRMPAISVGLARRKHSTIEFLQKIGLPVPATAVVRSAEAAVEAAERIGYPVVVKPADTDGGTAVSTNLTSAAAVRTAFETAGSHSRQVLVQKHVEGEDYRLTVFHGRLIWAVHRTPGGVTGDGEHSIEELVERLNSDPRRGTNFTSPLKVLTLDQEAFGLLEAQGMTPQSVPAAGKFVRLRAAANITRGGSVVAVNQLVHPDNARLAEQVASALGLDLAGIDLLIPDIGKSWMETGAHICEVNAQPQLGYATQQHLYGTILEELLPHGGRIPTVLCVGAGDCKDVVEAMKSHPLCQGANIGVASSSGTFLDDQRLLPPTSLYQSCEHLMTVRTVGMAIVVADAQTLLEGGLPLARFETMLIGLRGEEDDRSYRAVASLSARNVSGPIFVRPIGAPESEVARAFPGAEVFPDGAEPKEIAGRMIDALGLKPVRCVARPHS